MHKVYVYGTLRPGSGRTTVVPGKIYDLGWFPGLVLGDFDSGDLVVAEIIEVDDDGLSRLDQYEGYHENHPEDSLYIRRRHQDAEHGVGFVYVYNDDVSSRPVVESGDWLEYKSQNKGSNFHLGQR